VSDANKKTEENAREWTAKDEKTLALIVLGISKSQLSNIKKANTAKEAWDLLIKIYDSRGPVRRATLYKQLYRMKKESSIAMSRYISNFTTKAEQLEEAGITIPPDLLSIMLLGSLPSEYENFCIAIESRDEIPSIEALKSKLIEEEARQNDRVAHDDANNNALTIKTKTNRNAEPSKKGKFNESKSYKFDGKCFKCGKIGHRSRDCRSKTKNYISNKTDDALPAISCNVEGAGSVSARCDSAPTR